MTQEYKDNKSATSPRVIFNCIPEIVPPTAVENILAVSNSFLLTLRRNKLIAQVEYWDEKGVRHVGLNHKDLIKVYLAHQLLDGNATKTKDSRFIINDLKRKTTRIGWEQEYISAVSQAITSWLEEKPQQDLS